MSVDKETGIEPQVELDRLTKALKDRTTHLDNLPYLVYSVAVETERGGKLRFPFVYVNLAHVATVGADKQADLIGKTDFSIFKKSSASKAYLDYCYVVTHGQAVEKEETLADQNGKQHVFQVSKKPVLDDQGKVTRIDGVSIDITHEKELEAELVYHQALTSAAYLNSPDGIVQIDYETGDIILANKRFHIMNEYCVELKGVKLSRKASQFLMGSQGMDCSKTGEYSRVFLTPLATRVELDGLLSYVKDEEKPLFVYAFDLVQHDDYRLIGNPISVINLHNANLSDRKKYLRQLEDGPLCSDIQHITRTKQIILVRSNHHIVNLRAKKIVIGNDRDITQQEHDRDMLERKTRELAEANKKLEQLALQHPVSGLPNRRLLEINACNALNGAKRSRDSAVYVGLIFMDMEHFKEVNDNHGHEAGDIVLKEIGRRLQSVIKRKTDTVAHLGGDEFSILLPDLKNPALLLSLVNEIRNTIEKTPYDIGGKTVRLGVSIGTSAFTVDGEHPHSLERFRELLNIADQRMYTDKQTRRVSE